MDLNFGIAKIGNINVKICRIIYKMINYVEKLVGQTFSPSLSKKHLDSAQVKKFLISKSVMACRYIVGRIMKNVEKAIEQHPSKKR